MHTSKPLKKVVQILETRLQSNKNVQKRTKNCKIDDVDKKYTGVRFAIAFLCSILKQSKAENIKKNGTKLF